jgi:hypothetical protein
MVQPDVGRHPEDREELAGNWKGRSVGRRKRLQTLHPSTHEKK